MANPAESEVQNLLPVQAYFDAQGNFQTFIGQGKPFYATANPDQSGLNITSSTINSTTIGAITPSTGVFTNIATTTGTISTAPSSPTDIANKQYVDFYAAGLSWKSPVLTATSGNITLSGLQTINGVTVVAGDRVLVKDQSTASQNGIYIASASAWTYAVGADDWAEYVGAIVFVSSGSLNGTAWYCTAQPGGTLGVTAMNWSNFSVASSYTAGTGLTLIGTQFSITNTGVSAATYGSASSVPVFAVNAQGQLTSVTNTNIAINGNQITSGTIGSSYLSGSYSGITGLGTLGDLTVTNAIVGSITGNAATATTAGSATTATTATNLAGGATGSLPYQTASNTTGFLAAGTNGQILALASGVPSWIDNQTGTVTSVSGTGTVSGISLSGTVTSSGSLTLGGTLDLSSPPAIGGSTPNSITASTLTVNDTTTLGSSNTDTVNFTARINSEFTPATDNTYDLGRTGHEWRDLYITGTANIDSLVADTADINAGTIDNTVIGGTTPLAGTFTTLRVNSTISLAGSTGTSGYVLTSNGASAPTWSALPASGITVTDDTTTNATRYLTFTSATTGSITGADVSSTKLQYNPSTGFLSTTGSIVGAGTVSAPAITTTGDTNTGIFFPSADTIAFSEGGVESMRIDSSGNVGIGISSPGTKLQVVNTGSTDTRISVGNGNAGFQMGVEASGLCLLANFVAQPIYFATNGTERMRIASSGSVSIGNTTDNGSGRNGFTGTTFSPNIALTDAATVAWDTSTGQVATFTFVSTNRTMGAPTNLVDGGFYALAVIQNAGSNTLTWNSVFKWPSGTAPTLSTGAGAKDYFVFRSDGTNLYQQGASLGVA